MKIGFVKDAFGGIPHLIATNNDGNIEVKSITEYGKSIINNFDFDINNISQTVPDGFIFTGFFEKNLQNESTEIEKKITKKSFAYSGSLSKNVTKTKIFATNTLINRFSNPINKVNVIDFKAAAFKNSNKKSDFLNRVNLGKVIFDQRLARIGINPKFSFSHVEEEILRDSYGDGFIRKTVEKMHKNRRVSRRLRSLSSIEEIEISPTKNSVISRIDKARKDVKNGK